MAPRRQVEDLPGLNATSNPASSMQGAIAFAPRDNPLLDLAQSLKGINRQLGSYFDKQIEQQNEAAIAEGKRLAMLDDAKSYKQYVEKGGEPMASPWVQYGYKQQKGRVLGQAYSAFVSNKFQNWEGAGSDDIDGQAIVNQLPQWRQEFLQSQGDLDPVEMTGFDAYAITEEDNTVRSHIANERKQSMENYETQVYNEFYNLLSDPKLNQQQLHAKIEEVYQRQEFQGLRNMVAPLLLQATTDLAKNGDTSAVAKVREFTRKDAKTGQVIPIMKNTKAKAVLDDAEATAKRASITANNLAKAQQDQDKEARTDAWAEDKVRQLAQNRTPVDPITAAVEAADSGADWREAFAITGTLNGALKNTKNEQTENVRNKILLDLMTSRVPISQKALRQKIVEMQAVGGDGTDVEAIQQVYDKYQKSGKTIYDQYPELQALAASASADKYNGVSQDQANLIMARAVTKAVVAKTPEDKMVTRVANLFKTDIEAFAKSIQKLPQPTFAPGADYNSDGTKASKPAAGTGKPTAREQQSSLNTFMNSATVAELKLMQGKPRPEQDAFLAAKPVVPASYMVKAYQDAITKQPSVELTTVLNAAKTFGIDTSDPEKAINALMDRGQDRFYVAIKNARAKAKAKSQQKQ